MKRFCISLLLCLAGLSLQGQTDTDEHIREIASAGQMSTGIVSVKAVTLDGETVAQYNSSVRMLPASNVKLISTGLALNKLGPSFRYETKLCHSGSVEDGVLRGDLYIVGSGDPTTGMGGKNAIASLFGEWKDILTSSGINSIEGKIIADHRALGVIPVNESWLLEDVNCGDGLDSRGLNFAKNAKDFEHLFNPYFLTEPSPLDTCARAFGNYLAANEFHVSGEYSDSSCPGILPSSQLKTIGSTRSDRLSKILTFTNYTSDNFYAEAVMNKVLLNSSLKDELSALGVTELSGCRIVDGCGLSRKDYVTADFFCDFLVAMAGKDCFKEYLLSLPQPGKGTLVSRLREESPTLRNRIYMKSGSMSGVRCFSGYIMPQDDNHGHIIAFSVLTNNLFIPSKEAFGNIDRIIALIAAQN